MKKLVAVLAAAIYMAVPALGIAALAGANTVNSAAIIDGEVKTADIANPGCHHRVDSQWRRN